MTKVRGGGAPEPGDIVDAVVREHRDDTCELRFGDNTRARLTRYHSRLYTAGESGPDNTAVFTAQDHYQSGQTLRVRLIEQRDSGLWYVSERWVENPPWESPSVFSGDTVTGRVRDHAGSSFFVELDGQGLVALLPEREIPMADGSMTGGGEAPAAARLEIKIGDQIKAELLSDIPAPPRFPRISISAYLQRLERDAHSQPQMFMSGALAQTTLADTLSDENRSRLLSVTPETEPRLSLAGRRLLLVDDNEAYLQSTQRLLERYGAEVVALPMRESLSRAAERVLQLSSEQRPDLVLIDYELPGPAEGLRLARRLQSQDDTLPLGIISGLPREDFEELSRGLRLRCALQKPINFARLTEVFEGREIFELEASSPSVPASQDNDEVAGGRRLEHWLDRLQTEAHSAWAAVLEISPAMGLVNTYAHVAGWSQPNDISGDLRYSDFWAVALGKVEDCCINLVAGSHHHERLQHWNCGAIYGVNLGQHDSHSYLLLLGFRQKEPAWFRAEITARRMWRHLLRAVLEAERDWRALANHLPFITLGQLLGSTGHELRNRLAPLVQDVEYLEEVRKDLRQGGANQQRHALEVEFDGAFAAVGEHVKGLLEITSLLLGGLATRSGQTDVLALAKQIEADFSPLLRRESIHLTVQLPADPIYLSCAPASLWQPIANLLLNVIKHHHRRNGREAWLAFYFCKDTAALKVAVSDNGPGIHGEDWLRIFEAGVSHAKEENDQTGLGLYLSRRLLEHVGGSLEIETSCRGVGSIFSISLPVS